MCDDHSTAKCEWCGEEFAKTRHDKRFCCRDHQQKARKKRAYSSDKRSAQYASEMKCPLMRWLHNQRLRAYSTSDKGHANAARYRSRMRALAASDPAHPSVVKMRERARKAWRVREARNRGVDGTFSASELVDQAKRQHHKCFWCGHRIGTRPSVDYHPDHVVPLVLGGANDINNIVASCPSCNLRKGGKHPMEWAGRLC